jgi:hypothetical protein
MDIFDCLLQYGEIDQHGVYDFRHYLPVQYGVAGTKVTDEESVATSVLDLSYSEAMFQATL